MQACLTSSVDSLMPNHAASGHQHKTSGARIENEKEWESESVRRTLQERSPQSINLNFLIFVRLLSYSYPNLSNHPWSFITMHECYEHLLSLDRQCFLHSHLFISRSVTYPHLCSILVFSFTNDVKLPRVSSILIESALFHAALTAAYQTPH